MPVTTQRADATNVSDVILAPIFEAEPDSAPVHFEYLAVTAITVGTRTTIQFGRDGFGGIREAVWENDDLVNVLT